MNLDPGTLHTGHFSGGSGPSCTYPHTGHTHFIMIYLQYFIVFFRLLPEPIITLKKEESKEGKKTVPAGPASG
jgi:hypothetical protein